MTPATGTKKAELFKAKGAEILKPHNMEDFINEPQRATGTPMKIAFLFLFGFDKEDSC